MYLIIYRDNSVSQFQDNLTVDDIVAASTNIISIIRIGKDNIFEYLVKDEAKLCWVPVKQATVLKVKNFRLHQ